MAVTIKLGNGKAGTIPADAMQPSGQAMPPSVLRRPWVLLRSCAVIALGLVFHLGHAQLTYTFTNATANAHNTWDTGNNWATALTKPVNVSAVPTSGMVLRQINLDLGSTNGSNISTMAGRLTDPAGNTINVFNAGYFYNTDFSRYVDIKFRDHPTLKRLSDFTNSYLGMPYSFGYYRVETANSYAGLNTTTQVNGTWTFSMIENTGIEIQFNSVELVFGPPFTYVDIIGGSANSQCAQAQCVQSGSSEIVLGTNVNYPQGQPNFPTLTVNGCNWNAEPNNTSWFRFIASSTSVDLSISGFTNNPQQTIVLRNTGTCTAPSYSMVGCPWSMFVNGCNTTTGHPTLYHRVCYDGGTKFNHGYSLSGLTVGAEYILIVDGQSGANSTFYIEIDSGADNGCATPPVEPEITTVNAVDPGCDGTGGSITVVATGTAPLEYSIDGGLTFQADPVFTGLGAGTYAIVVRDPDGATAESSVTLVDPELPVIVEVQVLDPSCGLDDGSIGIVASGPGSLQYSIDGGATFQASNLFAGLAAGTYTVVVSNGCAVELELSLVEGVGPEIQDVNITGPACGADDGSIEIIATGPGPLEYSIDGGATFQSSNTFSGLAAGNYTIVVASTACSTMQEVTVTATDAPQIDTVVLVDPQCAGDTNGSIAITATGIGSLEYSIDGGALFQPAGTFQGLAAGVYAVVVRDGNGCTITAQVTLTAPVPVVLTAVDISDENCAAACDGSLLVSAEGADRYSVNGGATQANGLFEGLCAGTYQLTVANANGCSASAEVVIAGGTLVQAGFTADPTVIPTAGTPVEFTNTSSGALTYVWDFGGTGSSIEESPTFIFPIDEGTAQVCLVATAADGCSDTACVILRFGTPPTDVEVPTVFSPNGDGVNDIFGIIGDPGAVRAFSLRVYNRWGQLLFNGERSSQVWDGRQVSGEVVSDGTYYWTLDYTTEADERIERTGHVTLLR